LLVLAGILAVAAVLVNLRPREPQKPINLVPVVVARQDIEPYSTISSSQVTLGSAEIPETLAADYYGQPDEVVGFMATRRIRAGQQLRREDAKPMETVRYVDDMTLEIVSFPAIFSEMVAGQVKPGHRINIYGYQVESGKDRPGEAILVASNVWVVDVRTATGEEVEPEAGQTDQEAGGLFSAPGLGTLSQPGSVVAVAAPPEVVQDIIYAFGAKGYNAWVTLAPSAENIPPVAPRATPTPQPQETPTTIQPSPSLVGAVYMSDRDAGPKLDAFPNNTSVVWAIVNLQYSPDGPVAIRIDVHDQGGTLVFEGDFTHPRSGQESYLIVPTQGFTPDTTYTTNLYVGDKTFSAEWKLHGNAILPKTGGDTTAEDDGGGGD
jgi:hypothetical protein